MIERLENDPLVEDNEAENTKRTTIAAPVEAPPKPISPRDYQEGFWG